VNVLPMANFQAPEVHWLSLAPILIVLGGAVLGILVEAFAPAKARRPIVVGLSILATAGACVMLALRWAPVVAAPASLGEYIEDPLTIAAQSILMIIGFMAILVMADRTSVGDGAFAGQPSDRPDSAAEELTERKGYQRSEMFPLTLFSLGGMMIFPAADNFVTLFVSLEVMSLPLYIMAATARRRRQLSFEAALKYFVLGAFSSGFMLMGSAFLFGFANSLRISALGPAIANNVNMDWMVLIGVFCVMVGLLFKVGAAPFHAWTPDVYTGAPTPVTGFMAAAVKIAAFAAMARSSIAHAGFILMGILAIQKGGTGHVLFYTLGYGLATVGAFGVIALVRGRDAEGNVLGEATSLSKWAGIGRTHPWIAGSMLVFLLSFAGIPLTGGFVGKFVVFSDAIKGGIGWLAIVGLVASAITAFYYFRLVRVMFFTEPSEESVVVHSEGLSALAILVCALGTIALGVFPGPVLSLLEKIVILIP